MNSDTSVGIFLHQSLSESWLTGLLSKQQRICNAAFMWKQESSHSLLTSISSVLSICLSVIFSHFCCDGLHCSFLSVCVYVWAADLLSLFLIIKSTVSCSGSSLRFWLSVRSTLTRVRGTSAHLWWAWCAFNCTTLTARRSILGTDRECVLTKQELDASRRNVSVVFHLRNLFRLDFEVKWRWCVSVWFTQHLFWSE